MPESDVRSEAESGGRCRKAMYGMWQSLEEGAGKRCSECDRVTERQFFRKSKHPKGPKERYSLAQNNLQIFGVIPFIKNASSYHWRELPQVSFSSRQKLCRYKHTFVATKDMFCRDKHMFVATKRVCRDKSFVVTKMILMAAPVNESHSCFGLFSFASRRVTGPFSLPSNNNNNNILY